MCGEFSGWCGFRLDLPRPPCDIPHPSCCHARSELFRGKVGRGKPGEVVGLWEFEVLSFLPAAPNKAGEIRRAGFGGGGSRVIHMKASFEWKIKEVN